MLAAQPVLLGGFGQHLPGRGQGVGPQRLVVELVPDLGIRQVGRIKRGADLRDGRSVGPLELPVGTGFVGGSQFGARPG